MTPDRLVGGLHGEALSADTAILRCTYEDYALALRASSDAAGLDYVCYELAAGITLHDAARVVAGRGAAVRSTEVPVRGAALEVLDPDGNHVRLVARVRPDDTRPAEVRHSTRIPGWHPRKFGHVNFLTTDVARQVRWYTEVLGFRVTDWIGAEGVWLHVDRDHHVLAFLEKRPAHIHHLAFELVELFADLEQLPADHQPRHFPDDPHSSNTWGILPPRTYFRFDQAALDAEDSQAYAYGQPIPPQP